MEQQVQPSPAPPRQIPDDEIDLRDIVLVLWRYRWFIIGVFLVSVLAAGIISFATAPVYRVHTLIALGHYPSYAYTTLAPGRSGKSDADSLPQFLPLYTNPAAVRELLLSDDFLWQVVRELGLNIADKDFRQFKDTIEVEQVKDTGMLNISIETTDRKEGKAVLEKMVALFKSQSRPDFEQHRQLLTDQLGSVKARLLDVEKTIRETRENLAALETASGLTRTEKDFRRSQLLETLQGYEDQRLALLDRYLDLQKELNSLEDVKVIRSPREPVYPVKPNKKLNIALAGVLGLMIGVLGAFVIEFFRKNPLPRAG